MSKFIIRGDTAIIVKDAKTLELLSEFRRNLGIKEDVTQLFFVNDIPEEILLKGKEDKSPEKSKTQPSQAKQNITQPKQQEPKKEISIQPRTTTPIVQTKPKQQEQKKETPTQQKAESPAAQTKPVQHPIQSQNCNEPKYNSYPIKTRKDLAELKEKYKYESSSTRKFKFSCSQDVIKAKDVFENKKFSHRGLTLRYVGEMVEITHLPKVLDDDFEYVISYFGLEDIEWDYQLSKEERNVISFLNKFYKWTKIPLGDAAFSDILDIKPLAAKSLLYFDELDDEPNFVDDNCKKIPVGNASLFFTIFSIYLDDNDRYQYMKKFYKEGKCVYTLSIISPFRVEASKSEGECILKFENSKLFSAEFCAKQFDMAFEAFRHTRFETFIFRECSKDKFDGDQFVLARICRKNSTFASITPDVLSEYKTARSFNMFVYYINESQKEQFESEILEKFGPFEYPD